MTIWFGEIRDEILCTAELSRIWIKAASGGAAGPASAPGCGLGRPRPGHAGPYRGRADQRSLAPSVIAIAIAYGPSPTSIGVPAVLVAVAIGVTMPGSPQTTT
jgi:hypothetical protein